MYVFLVTSWVNNNYQVFNSQESPVVFDYFEKTFAANPWIRFDSALPRQSGVEIFLAWICDYNEEHEYGKSSLSLQLWLVLKFSLLPPSINYDTYPTEYFYFLRMYYNIPHTVVHRIFEKMIPFISIFADEMVVWSDMAD